MSGIVADNLSVYSGSSGGPKRGVFILDKQRWGGILIADGFLSRMKGGTLVLKRFINLLQNKCPLFPLHR